MGRFRLGPEAMSGWGAKLDGTVKLAPERSQTAVIAVLCLAAVSCIATGFFAWHDRPVWLPSSFALLFTFLGVWMWARSHAQEAEPTHISVQGDRFQLEAPAAAFNNRENFQRLQELVSVLRVPLPAPNGMVGRALEPLPGTEDAAKRAVDVLNSQTAEREHAVLKMLAPADQTYVVEHVEVPIT